jgi:hypothetical protein
MDDGEGMRASRCLYTMQEPRSKEILYLGKAWGSTVSRRLHCRSKLGVWDALEDYDLDACAVLLGEVSIRTGWRMTDAMLSDIESLLILAEQPPGNRQCRISRGITRPGLCVACVGRWPGGARHYIDGAPRQKSFN